MEHTHAYSSWVVVDEPTCTKEGLRERTCSCGEKETEQIAALGHSAGEAVRENEKAPTCTEKGSYEEVVYCTVCEEEVSRKTVEVAPLDHTPGEAVKENEKAPTCTEKGSYEEAVYCTVCEAEVSRKTITIDALKHDYKGVVTDEPLCIMNGEKTYTCTRCGDSYTETIDALGHGWGETKPGQAPTCTSTGYTSYKTCLRCGYTTRETIPALQHDWSEWTVTTPATCTTAGEEERTCSRCQETETQTIDALDHAWSAYSFDETNHWRECTRAGCSAKEEAKHSFTRNTYETCGYAFYSEGLLYEVNNDTDTVTITGEGTCSDTTIYIPAVIDEKPVTEIGNYAFLRCTSLKEVVIPQSVTSIGSSAFNYCTSLEEVVFPEGVISIGEGAFQLCELLKEIVIPDSVTTIGDSAFDGCDELTTVYYRGSKEQWDSIIGSNKDALTGVQIICDYTGE